MPRLMHVICPSAVLDTNVVLDCFVFKNAECDALLNAITSGVVTWVASHEMGEELFRVVSLGHLSAWQPDPVLLGEQWARWCVDSQSLAVDAVRAGHLRCTDRDDQKFIDFSVAVGARWLVSRDRAVLKLARRLREHGVEVVSPPHWGLRTAA
jgi:predicted nucleic acid-binding protein